jgi:cation:H+ antiporter
MSVQRSSWRGRWGWLLLAAAGALPAAAERVGLIHLPVAGATGLYGLAIVGAAFLLTWACEAAERDISAALAVAFLALVAVLPEYAVDMTFAWKAGHQPEYAAYAAANMTGGNRLLVGLGWAAVVFFFWLKTRTSVLELARSHTLEFTFLAAATLYGFVIPLKGNLAVYDAVILIGLFAVYLWFAARHESEEGELLGPAASIGALPKARRRALLVALFTYAAGVIALSAEEFAAGLVETGTSLGVDRFLLVQWLAPLASEAPEFIAAILLTWRGRAGAGMGALISSKVNQWTLLVGGLPVAYALSRGDLVPLHLDARQNEELLLTAAQSLFALATLLSLSISLKEAAALALLFLAQFAFESTAARVVFSLVYIVLALGMLWYQRRNAGALWRWWRRERLPGARATDRQPVPATEGDGG